MKFAAAVRPVVDRVYTGLRRAAMPRQRELYESRGLKPGVESSFYYGLLARPMSAEAFADAEVYTGGDLTASVDQGIVTIDPDGACRLTKRGEELATALQVAVADGAEELWTATPIATMPGLRIVPRLVELTGKLLHAGGQTGGSVFHAVAPVFEPLNASPCLLLTTRLGAWRNHRADAHRAAWRERGLSVAEFLALADGPQRQAIEDETNRRDAQIYNALTADEQRDLLAGLGALPG